MKISSPIIMTYPGPPRRAGMMRNVVLAAVFIVAVYFYLNNEPQSLAIVSPFLSSNPDAIDQPAVQTPGATISHHSQQYTTPSSPKPDHALPPIPSEPKPTNPHSSTHPIDTLIKDAQTRFEGLLEKESHDVNTAAAEYRKRRGRHPPPGFDFWFDFAQENEAIVVEDFFDQIYHDLGPFWGLPASTMRKESWDYDMVINVRNQNASSESTWFWAEIWLDLMKTIEHLLPDLDIPLNAMDEPRVVVPWEEINEYMRLHESTRIMPPATEVIREFQALPPPGYGDVETASRPKDWENELPFWKLAIRGCPPDSLARQAPRATDFSRTPSISMTHATPHLSDGFVSNFSLSKDFCHQPDLQSLHGMMIAPLSVSTTKRLIPMFGGSKLPTNNEILLPAPMYWSNEERFTGGDTKGGPWFNKTNQVMWRGVATGGRNSALNWKGFQRHRFVAMTNGTQIAAAEANQKHPANFALPAPEYNIAAQKEGRLGNWTKGWANTGFVDLMCSPEQVNGTCNYTSPYFDVVPGVSMGNQFNRKFLPDIDGNSFSGRYRGFLMSTSLPIKATIFKEWHDSRLVEWKHFVPMDNRFMDFYGIMEYFLGYHGEGKTSVPNHDQEAQKIATEGQEWANKVLRREDMQIYTLRLLLEYARLADDRRQDLGWVDDLLPPPPPSEDDDPPFEDTENSEDSSPLENS